MDYDENGVESLNFRVGSTTKCQRRNSLRFHLVIVCGLYVTSFTTVASWSLSNVLMTGTKASSAYTDSVAIGIQKGMEECRNQFVWERWNCPNNAFTRTKSMPAHKEAAFVHAIISSGVMHTVTRNCSSGHFENCACNFQGRGKQGKGRDKWSWGGCSENVQFGSDISRDFLDHRESGKDPRAVVIRHNSEAGRKAVIKSMKRLCKCHGVSGSCSTQTCWMQLSDFRTIGKHLKHNYERAIKVDYNNGILSIGEDTSKRFLALSKSSLVHLDSSPNYCLINLTAGAHGTLGRECSRKNQTSRSERRSCRKLCRQCGLRVQKTIAEVTVSCNCKFHWCCEVKCDVCRKIVNKLRCVR